MCACAGFAEGSAGSGGRLWLHARLLWDACVCESSGQGEGQPRPVEPGAQVKTRVT